MYKTAHYTLVNGDVQKATSSKTAKIINGYIIRQHLANVNVSIGAYGPLKNSRVIVLLD